MEGTVRQMEEIGRETDEDEMNNGRLSTSSETDIQEPPKPAPRKRAEPQAPSSPTPRSPDHRPDNG